MHDLIVFAEDFGGLPSSTQHLIRRLATDRKVVWINSIGLRQPTLSLIDGKRMINKCFRFGSNTDNNNRLLSETHDDKHNIQQVNLLTIPAPESPAARNVAKHMMLTQLRPLLEQLKLEKPILWSSLPTAADLCGHLGESAVVYYCGDDFSSLAGVDHKTVSEHEIKMATKADLILTASEKLKLKFPGFKTQLLPHGVDTALFSTPAARAKDLPSNKTTQKRPIAGFYGSISNWLDYPLLEQVTEALPEWDFVFIGPIALSKNPLPKRDNVHYLGPRQHDKLPSYCQHWDVSMLPFKLTEQIRSCNPLKLMEYMAAGQPVVTTDFPALAPYRQYVHCASGASEFIDSLNKAKSAPKIPTSAVRQQSWDDRSQFLSWLMELL